MKKSLAAGASRPTNDAVPKMPCGHPADGPVWVLADPTLFGRELGIEVKQCMAPIGKGKATCGKLVSMALIQPTVAQPPPPGGGRIVMP